jgi:hypothetical protein
MPSDFCELGILRFEDDLKRFSYIAQDICKVSGKLPPLVTTGVPSTRRLGVKNGVSIGARKILTWNLRMAPSASNVKVKPLYPQTLCALLKSAAITRSNTARSNLIADPPIQQQSEQADYILPYLYLPTG